MSIISTSFPDTGRQLDIPKRTAGSVLRMHEGGIKFCCFDERLYQRGPLRSAKCNRPRTCGADLIDTFLFATLLTGRRLT
jgi:hypothetical protein